MGQHVDEPLEAQNGLQVRFTSNGGVKTMTFTVRLSAASGKSISVDYATADGTATTALEVLLPDGAQVVDLPAVPGWAGRHDPAAGTITWGGCSASGKCFPNTTVAVAAAGT